MPGTLSAAAAALLLATCASAYPSLAASALDKRQDANPYEAPGPTDDRTACPGLNTMANHGFINRNGRGISKQMMQQGFLDAFGMAFDATDAGGSNSINLCSQLTGTTCTAFDLSQLNTPHAIEHDGSLSRIDAEMAWNLVADNHSFNQTVWDTTLNVYSPSTHISPSAANTARLFRIQQAKLDDAPNWFIENDGGSGAEHAFTLTTMHDPAMGDVNTNPQARVDWVDYWFSHERLPTDLGWVKPTPISNNQVAACANSVFNAPTYSIPSPKPKPTTTSTSSSSLVQPTTTVKPTITKVTTSTVPSTFISTVVTGTSVSVAVDSTVTTFTHLSTTQTTSVPAPSTYVPGTSNGPAPTPSVTDKPTSTPSTTDKPASTPSTTDKPASTPSTTDKPASTPSTTDKPASTPSTTDKPAPTPSTTDKPTSAPSTIDKPAPSTTNDKPPHAVWTWPAAPGYQSNPWSNDNQHHNPPPNPYSRPWSSNQWGNWGQHASNHAQYGDHVWGTGTAAQPKSDGPNSWGWSWKSSNGASRWGAKA